ncbi:MAG TPA: PEP-CTERM sorting domain-containing protein [Rhodanobacter sp.]|nr:PEP-CTERM sorting domain-containing protein [Rhodanobacter sp.]
MMKKKTIGIALACALAMGAWSSSSLATPVSVNGVNWNTNDGLYLTLDSFNLRESTVSKVGDVLTGYGQIGSIDGNNGFCSSCDLTFTFTYTVQSVNGNQVVFNAGSYQFYTQAAGSYNVLNPNSVGGTPWVTMTGHTQMNATFTDDIGQLFATINGTVADPTNGSGGLGLVDATAGPAMSVMDFNNVADGLGGFADLNLNSSFLTKPIAGCTTISPDPTDKCHYPIGGTGELTGAASPMKVPEPGALGMLGLGLGALGFAVWRRRKETDDRA